MIEKGTNKKQGVYACHVTKGDLSYVYIGSGVLGDRMSGNPSKLRRNVHSNKQLQAMYNECGICKMEILQVCESIEEARDLENDYIDFYKRLEQVVVCNKYKSCTTKKYKIVLDEEKVIEIKSLLAQGKMKNKDIAAFYGVTDSVISKIKTGLRWSSVNIEKAI